MALVVFRSKAAGEIFMFAETARRLLAIIGKQDSPRGVISAEQIADALARLTAAVEEEKAQIRQAREASEAAQRRGEAAADEAAQAITLGQRAHPLLEMLRAAERKRVDVTWGV
jgi:methyl-accepting chemotaxis protein